ncbi:hypothetical protein QYF61_021416 [Mycteria americana]|uniref:Uncharacterized protein n=1 Tax=Mycteria americana TaxID=33587 RepID=A0AAN7PKV6_MYCAM|nr:hypothetical protein QYF61_021416 [Mycteria americana]
MNVFSMISANLQWKLSCIRQSIASRLKEVILSLYSALAPQYKRHTDTPEGVQQRDTKMVTGAPLSCEGRLRELGLFSLEKRRLRGILSMCINT